MKSLALSSIALVLVIPVGGAGVLLVSVGTAGAGNPPSAEAVEDVPETLLPVYMDAAARCPGLPWPVLAAIGKVESDHGRAGGAKLSDDGTVEPWILGPRLDGSVPGTRVVRDTDGGRYDRDPEFDRAVGPMQFLPATWERWGLDATGDGVANPHNVYDAIVSAAAYLCGEAGVVSDLEAALLSYNRSLAYVTDVLDVAGRYGSLSLTGFPLDVTTETVLTHPNLTLVASARADLESGLVDPRVVALLALAADHFEIGVGVIKTGHSECVGGGSRAQRPGCRVSHHFEWRAVDLHAVNGIPVSRSNLHARALADFLVRLPEPLRPDELGVPFPELTPLPGVFSDAAHRHHIHAGFRPTATPAPQP